MTLPFKPLSKGFLKLLYYQIIFFMSLRIYNNQNKISSRWPFLFPFFLLAWEEREEAKWYFWQSCYFLTGSNPTSLSDLPTFFSNTRHHLYPKYLTHLFHFFVQGKLDNIRVCFRIFCCWDFHIVGIVVRSHKILIKEANVWSSRLLIEKENVWAVAGLEIFDIWVYTTKYCPSQNKQYQNSRVQYSQKK